MDLIKLIKKDYIKAKTNIINKKYATLINKKTLLLNKRYEETIKQNMRYLNDLHIITENKKIDFSKINLLNERYEYAVIINPDNTTEIIDIDNLDKFKYKDGVYFIDREDFKISFIQRIIFREKIIRIFKLKSMSIIGLFRSKYRKSYFYIYNYNNPKQIGYKNFENVINSKTTNIFLEQRLIEQLKAEKKNELNILYLIIAVAVGGILTYLIMTQLDKNKAVPIPKV